MLLERAKEEEKPGFQERAMGVKKTHGKQATRPELIARRS